MVNIGEDRWYLSTIGWRRVRVVAVVANEARCKVWNRAKGNWNRKLQWLPTVLLHETKDI
jgi:hypothetical protein